VEAKYSFETVKKTHLHLAPWLRVRAVTPLFPQRLYDAMRHLQKKTFVLLIKWKSCQALRNEDVWMGEAHSISALHLLVLD
jgi:hypothetical protein